MHAAACPLPPPVPSPTSKPPSSGIFGTILSSLHRLFPSKGVAAPSFPRRVHAHRMATAPAPPPPPACCCIPYVPHQLRNPSSHEQTACRAPFDSSFWPRQAASFLPCSDLPVTLPLPVAHSAASLAVNVVSQLNTQFSIGKRLKVLAPRLLGTANASRLLPYQT